MQGGSAPHSGPYPRRRSLRSVSPYPSRRSLRPEPDALPTRRALRESGAYDRPNDQFDASSEPPETSTIDHDRGHDAPAILNSDQAEDRAASDATPSPVIEADDPDAAEEASAAMPELFDVVQLLPPPPGIEVRPARVVEATERRTRRPTPRRIVAVSAALCCAAGLFVAMAVPALGTSSGDEPASAISRQELAGDAEELGTVDPLSALGSVSAEASGIAADFVNFRNASVQFPFASGQVLTDGFGPRSYPVSGMHDAQDFAAPEGTTVQAIARGTVLETGDTTDGCGFGVLIEHTIDGKRLTSRYCHMQYGSNDLAVGQTVQVGDAVGRVGATGIAFGAHLHFALTIDGEAVDPMPFLLQYNRSTRS